jgi:hypothetical protein
MKANAKYTIPQPTRANQATATPAAREARDRALLDLADLLGDIKSGLCALDMATDALGNHHEENAFYSLIKAVEEKVTRASAIVDAALIANRCPAAG